MGEKKCDPDMEMHRLLDDLADLLGADSDDDVLRAAQAAERLSSFLREREARALEEAAAVADPAPGPEPRDFQAHRIRVSTRRWIASELRRLAAERRAP